MKRLGTGLLVSGIGAMLVLAPLGEALAQRGVRSSRNVNVNRNVNVQGNVGRRGGVAVGEEGAVAAGRRGVAVVGEEGAAVARRGGWGGTAVYHNDYEGAGVAGFVAGAMTAAVIGSMVAAPPPAATTVVVQDHRYYYSDQVFYEPVYHGGTVAYQVVAPPPGAVVPVLPAGCTAQQVGPTVYQVCSGVYYVPVATGGYQIVTPP
jgi:hypothetical protein